ncbi:MAG: hypothetical protein HWN81_13985 [Candidatus Lokiarchaeota archaeon]|nr:hypothetical protein [Candidatus Lokiarchaeota archaeon]
MVTMNEMASSYANNLQEEIKRAENNLEEQQRYIAQLRSHLNECINALQNNTSNQNTTANSPPASVPLSAVNPQLESRIKNEDGSTSETYSVNPFIQSK